MWISKNVNCCKLSHLVLFRVSERKVYDIDRLVHQVTVSFVVFKKKYVYLKKEKKKPSMRVKNDR